MKAVLLLTFLLVTAHSIPVSNPLMSVSANQSWFMLSGFLVILNLQKKKKKRKKSFIGIYDHLHFKFLWSRKQLFQPLLKEPLKKQEIWIKRSGKALLAPEKSSCFHFWLHFGISWETFKILMSGSPHKKIWLSWAGLPVTRPQGFYKLPRWLFHGAARLRITVSKGHAAGVATALEKPLINFTTISSPVAGEARLQLKLLLWTKKSLNRLKELPEVIIPVLKTISD